MGGPLGVDVLDVAALDESGVDVASPISLAVSERGSLLCFTAKGKTAAARLNAALAEAGRTASRAYKGAKLTGSTVQGRWRAGFAAQGSGMCVSSGSSDALAALKAAVDAMNGAGLASTRVYGRATAGLEGGTIAYSRHDDLSIAFQVKASRKGLWFEGRVVAGKPLLQKPTDAHPLAQLQVTPAVLAMGTLSKQALSDSVGPMAELEFLAQSACRSCPPAVIRKLLEEVKTKLSGPQALLVTGVDPSAADEPQSRYYLFPHAYLLTLKDAAGSKAALAGALAQLRAIGVQIFEAEARGEGAHWTMGLGMRQLYLGVAGNTLYVANEKGARDMALAALEQAKPGKSVHAASFTLDGPAVAAALKRISILDVPRSRELAALFGFSIEAGALLNAVGPVSGFADPEPEGARFQVGFELKK
jgi:hypothetical protein